MGLEVWSICPLNLGWNRTRADDLASQRPPRCTPVPGKRTGPGSVSRSEITQRRQITELRSNQQYLFTENRRSTELIKVRLLKSFSQMLQRRISRSGMRARLKKNSSAAERRNAQKLLKSCQWHSGDLSQDLSNSICQSERGRVWRRKM